jgi:non-ribosomal peptide synthetase component E (peptide arylation enzyme)
MSPLLTLHDPRLARAYYAAGYWRDDTLYSLLCQHADIDPVGQFAPSQPPRAVA